MGVPTCILVFKKNCRLIDAGIDSDIKRIAETCRKREVVYKCSYIAATEKEIAEVQAKMDEMLKELEF